MLKLQRPAACVALALLMTGCRGQSKPAPTTAAAPNTAAAATTPSAAPTPAAAAHTSPQPASADAVASAFAGSSDATIAYDAASHRAFVVNVADARIDILDITDPTAAQVVGAIDVSSFGQEPTSVAARNGLVAIAVEANKKTANGTLVLADSNGAILDSVTVGAQPVAVAFTPDGGRLVVANQGAANKEGTKNPEGSISIIDLGKNRTKVGQADVRSADFAQFNGAPLDPAIRIIDANATVAQDLEPSAIAIAADGLTARIALPRNHAVALVDIAAASVTALLPLEDAGLGSAVVQQLRDLPIADLPTAGTTAAGQALRLGGFSALVFTGADPATGMLRFLALTDRGPNASPADAAGAGVAARPFPLPAFTPRIVRLEVDPAAGVARYTGEILLADANGTPLTGLPNRAGAPGIANSDEPAIDLFGNPIAFDPTGIDPEGMAVAADGSYWIAEENRPSLLHFDAAGRLMRRFVPIGANSDGGVTQDVEALPGALMQRTTNHGFEAAALDGDILYAFMQKPIDNPDRADDANAKASRIVRIIAFDTVAEQTVGQYLYVLDGGNVDKIGDAIALGDGEFLVIERDDILGPSAQKFIYKISLAGATNLEDDNVAALAGPNQGLEVQPLPLLALAGILPVQKQLYLDLTAAGYLQADKLEGLARIDATHLALVNDDDFGLSGAFDPTTGLLTPNPAPMASLLTLLDLQPARE